MYIKDDVCMSVFTDMLESIESKQTSLLRLFLKKSQKFIFLTFPLLSTQNIAMWLKSTYYRSFS